MKVELPLGDIVDKVTILRIKAQRIDDAAKVENVKRELSALLAAWSDQGYAPMETLDEWTALLEVNGALWTVEDEIREQEAQGEFGAGFVALARSVYRLNDKRAALKHAINIRLGSRLVEEKSYEDYSAVDSD